MPSSPTRMQIEDDIGRLVVRLPPPQWGSVQRWLLRLLSVVGGVALSVGMLGVLPPALAGLFFGLMVLAGDLLLWELSELVVRMTRRMRAHSQLIVNQAALNAKTPTRRPVALPLEQIADIQIDDAGVKLTVDGGARQIPAGLDETEARKLGRLLRAQIRRCQVHPARQTTTIPYTLEAMRRVGATRALPAVPVPDVGGLLWRGLPPTL